MCIRDRVKSQAKEGYNAVQLGFGHAKRLNRPERGHLKNLGSFRYLRELRQDDLSGVELGQQVTVDIFSPGDKVDVVGTSKGRGFAGVVKRHGFAGGPKTHGQKDRHRAPGSVGGGTDPGKTFKGQRMAGHMGNERVTVKNLKVVKADMSAAPDVVILTTLDVLGYAMEGTESAIRVRTGARVYGLNINTFICPGLNKPAVLLPHPELSKLSDLSGVACVYEGDWNLFLTGKDTGATLPTIKFFQTT